MHWGIHPGWTLMYIQHGHYPKNVEQVYRLVLHGIKSSNPQPLAQAFGGLTSGECNFHYILRVKSFLNDN